MNKLGLRGVIRGKTVRTTDRGLEYGVELSSNRYLARRHQTARPERHWPARNCRPAPGRSRRSDRRARRGPSVHGSDGSQYVDGTRQEAAFIADLPDPDTGDVPEVEDQEARQAAVQEAETVAATLGRQMKVPRPQIRRRRLDFVPRLQSSPPPTRRAVRLRGSTATLPPAAVVKLVDTADLKSAASESRRAGSNPARGTIGIQWH